MEQTRQAVEVTSEMVLTKALERKPKVAVVLLITEEGRLSMDFSAPAALGDLIMLKDALNVRIQGIVASMLLNQEKAAPPKLEVVK